MGIFRDYAENHIPLNAFRNTCANETLKILESEASLGAGVSKDLSRLIDWVDFQKL